MHILILMLILRDKAWFVFQLSQAILKLSHTQNRRIWFM